MLGLFVGTLIPTRVDVDCTLDCDANCSASYFTLNRDDAMRVATGANREFACKNMTNDGVALTAVNTTAGRVRYVVQAHGFASRFDKAVAGYSTYLTSKHGGMYYDPQSVLNHAVACELEADGFVAAYLTRYSRFNSCDDVALEASTTTQAEYYSVQAQAISCFEAALSNKSSWYAMLYRLANPQVQPCTWHKSGNRSLHCLTCDEDVLNPQSVCDAGNSTAKCRQKSFLAATSDKAVDLTTLAIAFAVDSSAFAAAS